MSLRVGLYLPQVRISFATIVERVAAAEEAGFESVWFMDHLYAPVNPSIEVLEGWTLASAVAARTARIRIGHLVLCDAFRHPAVLAKMAATLDVISGGRFDLGLGWGSVDDELRVFGIEPRDRASRARRLDETLQVLRLLWSGEPVEFAGDHLRLEGAVCRPVPLQGSVPIHIGGAGRRLTMPLVARHADWWNCPGYGVDRLDELRPLAGTARVSVQQVVGLATSGAELGDVEATARRRFGAGWGSPIVGTPDSVVERLDALRRRGVELAVVQFTDYGQPETLALFGREVLPALR